MLLSQITVDPKRFQLRDKPFSENTVNGILREGLDVARFDPLPLLPTAEGVLYVVAGDGHSRYEAIRRLAETAALPDAWAVGDDWDVPSKIVTDEQASRLRYANLQRDNFTATEEARIFQQMLSEGLSISDAAERAHRSIDYVKQMLPLNGLAECIKGAIGRSADGGGIDKGIAIAMAERFQRHGIEKAQQQELYLKVFAHSPLSVEFVRAAIDEIAPRIKETVTQGVLFAVPASVTAAVKDMKDRARRLAKVTRAVRALVSEAGSDVLNGLPELQQLLQVDGERMLGQLEYEVASDGQVIGQLVAA